MKNRHFIAILLLLSSSLAVASSSFLEGINYLQYVIRDSENQKISLADVSNKMDKSQIIFLSNSKVTLKIKVVHSDNEVKVFLGVLDEKWNLRAGQVMRFTNHLTQDEYRIITSQLAGLNNIIQILEQDEGSSTIGRSPILIAGVGLIFLNPISNLPNLPSWWMSQNLIVKILTAVALLPMDSK